MSKPVKICHLTSAHPDGDVRIFHKECVSLANAGHMVYLVIPNTTSRVEKGVEIVSFESNYTTRKERMTKTVQQVHEHALKIDADIYHLHDPELLKLVNPLKKAGKMVIYDVHEDLPRQILSKHWLPKPVRKIISVVAEIYENRVSKKCDGIITATPFIRKRFLKINSNTIDVNNYPIKEELMMDYDYNLKTEKAICYIGGITKTRGIEEIVRSVEDSDTTLLIGGSFLEEGLREKIVQLKGWKNVEELGFLNRTQVKEVYKRAKLGLVTLHPIINYIDALPVKMFEYMAAGLPVVASNFPLWKSIIESNECGICVDPMNPTEISQATNQILGDVEMAKKMGENGKKMIEEVYNWENEEEKLTTFYHQTIEQKNR